MTTVGVIGLGYVGLPLAVAFAAQGCEIVAIDLDHRKVQVIGEGRSHIAAVSSERLAAVGGRIKAATGPAALGEADAVIVCVPTPLSANREPELGPLVDAARALGGVLRQGQLVVIESTTYPGTTRERLAPVLEESGLA